MVTVIPTLELDQTIWRYMPLEQLLAILGMSTLHFQPLSKMRDLSEGYLPAEAREATKQQLPLYIPDECRDTVVKMCMGQTRRGACVSCWHMNSDESAAMWSLYAPTKGIAIRSTLQRLQSSFKDFPNDVMIAPVRYYAAAEARAYAHEALCGNLFIKWKSYEHEHELRALTFCTDGGQPFDTDSGIDGVDVPIEPSGLIEHLFVSPEAPNWIVSVVRETVKRYLFDFPIDKSPLATLS